MFSGRSTAPRDSRYSHAVRRTRREVLRGSVIASIGVLIASCGGKSTASVATSPAQTPSAGTEKETNAATTGGSASAATTGETSAPEQSGPTFDPGQQLRVALTYVAGESGRRVHNPYIAVWIEDSQNLLV